MAQKEAQSISNPGINHSSQDAGAKVQLSVQHDDMHELCSVNFCMPMLLSVPNETTLSARVFYGL